MPQESKSRTLDQYIVRFPDGLRDKIKAAAGANGRSMNAEIVARLEEHDVLVRKAYAVELRANLSKEEVTRLSEELRVTDIKNRELEAKLLVANERNKELEAAVYRDVRPDAFQRKLAVAQNVTDQALGHLDDRARENVAAALAKWIGGAYISVERPSDD